MLLTVILNYMVPKEVFTWVTSITLIGTLWTWGIIMLSHRNYRRAVQAGRAAAAPFRMPGAPFANWAVLRSEEHTSELQSQSNLVCRLLLDKKNNDSSLT